VKKSAFCPINSSDGCWKDWVRISPMLWKTGLQKT